MSAEWVSALSNAVMALAAGVAAVFAAVGVGLWRKQLTGTSEHEVARRCLRAVYAVEEAVARARRPAVTRDEPEPGPKPQAPPFSAIEEREAREIWYYDDRLRGLVETLAELRVAALEAKTMWGQEAGATLSKIVDVAGELAWARDVLLSEMNTRNGAGTLARENRAIMYAFGKQPDAWQTRFDAACAAAETLLAPHVRSRK